MTLGFDESEGDMLYLATHTGRDQGSRGRHDSYPFPRRLRLRLVQRVTWASFRRRLYTYT